MTTNQLGTQDSYLGNINLGELVNMPAIIHFTQAPRDGGTGQSAIGFVAGQPVTMIDDGGPGANTYLWEILNWPAPLAAAPVITNATSQIAMITPARDGAYLVKLTRTEGIITTTDVRFFAVADSDGLSLPTAGITGRIANIGASPLLAQAAGWMGRADAGTDVMLDAYLRWLKGRLGGYVGKSEGDTQATGDPVTRTLVVGTNAPSQSLDTTGAGAYIYELSAAGAISGDAFWLDLTTHVGAGSVTIKNGIAGAPLLTIPAPPAGAFTYHVEVGFLPGSGWTVRNVTCPELTAMPQSETIPGVTGIQPSQLDVFTRIGTLRIDPSKYPANARVTFWAFLEATAAKVAECKLVNLTDGGEVAGSLLTGDQQVATYYEVTVTLPSGPKDYEVQLRMTPTMVVNTEVAACSSAGVTLVWR